MIFIKNQIVSQIMDRYTKRPLYAYVLYAQLLRAYVLEECGDHKAALEIIPLYMDGNWIREDNEEVRRIIAQYQDWGRANTYLNRLMDGQFEVLGEYVEYISTRENEIFIALFRIVQAANRYNWNVDNVLQRFSGYIRHRKYSSIFFGERNNQMMSDQHKQFCSELATYYLSRNRYKGDEVSMQGVDLSAKLDSEHHVIRGTISVDFEIAISDEKKVVNAVVHTVKNSRRDSGVSYKNINCLLINLQFPVEFILVHSAG
ncbi:hypothetical protein ACFTAO_44195 [Paenibacillus rhizoplanae]